MLPALRMLARVLERLQMVPCFVHESTLLFCLEETRLDSYLFTFVNC